MHKQAALALLFWLATLTAAHAVEPDEMLKDPALESRARALTQELRCVVCQNQSVDDSDAPLAHDIRKLVRDRVAAGETDDEVKAFVVARYGNFVLLRPPLQGDTIVLWFAPVAFLGFGLLLAWQYLRGRQPSNEGAPLSDDEQAALRRLQREA